MIDLGKLPLVERAAWLLSNVVNPTLADLRKMDIPSDDRARGDTGGDRGGESRVEHRDQVDAADRDVLGLCWDCGSSSAEAASQEI